MVTITRSGPEQAVVMHVRGKGHDPNVCAMCSLSDSALDLLTMAAVEMAAHADTAARLVATREAFNRVVTP